ncbi:cephalosporin esterase precursor [Rhodotorula diobovata]|uniref:Carboxylic ester hydrolase n=1 Tax=Rhodotorula diobovata TaxID=5288 RepID=A0A5C5FUB8_9BASI|nr:cephalosporin esterase precursor [Rhodotorula diobovata]
MRLALISLFSFLTALQLASASPTPSHPLVVDLGYARYCGYHNTTSSLLTWRGIRYAVAPRFQAPQTPPSAAAIRDADEYGPVCWQAMMGTARAAAQGLVPGLEGIMSPGRASEDCLFLNVVAPVGTREGDGLPVVVWIHGGGYAVSDVSAGKELDAFARHVGFGMVIVQIQYRLGPFGFLAGQVVKDHGATNAALLDQQFALQWVQRHVSKFGGDPGQVTLWGDSAGAGSILNHIVAHGGNTTQALGLDKPLFQAALVASVFLPLQVEADSPWAEHLYDKLARATNCTAPDTSSSFACLSSVDASVLAAAGVQISAAAPFGFWTYAPVIDGTFLIDRASVLLARGKAHLNGERLTATNNVAEGLVFTDPTLANDSTTDPQALAAQFDALVAGLFPLLTPEDRQAVAREYPIEEAGTQTQGITFARVSSVLGDATLVCPTYWLASAFAPDAHKGLFSYGPGTHGFDSLYYSGAIWDGQKSVSSVQSLDGALGGFLRAGDPNLNPANSTVNPAWPAWDPRAGRQRLELVFGTERSGDTLSEARPRVVRTGEAQVERCAFWRGEVAARAGL